MAASVVRQAIVVEAVNLRVAALVVLELVGPFAKWGNITHTNHCIVERYRVVLLYNSLIVPVVVTSDSIEV